MTLDGNIGLHYAMIGAPAIRADMTGHEYSRSSGNLGAGAEWEATDRLSVYAGYDMIIEDGYLGHQANAGTAWRF